MSINSVKSDNLTCVDDDYTARLIGRSARVVIWDFLDEKPLNVIKLRIRDCGCDAVATMIKNLAKQVTWLLGTLSIKALSLFFVVSEPVPKFFRFAYVLGLFTSACDFIRDVYTSTIGDAAFPSLVDGVKPVPVNLVNLHSHATIIGGLI